MSKTFTQNLTPAQKRRRATERVDAMTERCHRIETLAALLAASGEPLAARVVSETGYWIGEEAQGLKALLAAIGKETR